MWLILKEKLNTLDLLAHKKISQVENCVFCDIVCESSHYLFVECYYTNFIWDSIKQELQITESPKSMLKVWTSWRQTYVKSDVMIEWDKFVVTVCWFLWSERNNRIFSRKYRSNVALYASINSYIAFWLANLPKKKWKTFVRSRMKARAGRKDVEQVQHGAAADNCSDRAE